MASPRFIWSPELTSAFINLRSTHDELFTKRRNSASLGYSIILQKLVDAGHVDMNTLTPRQLRKKWENLLKRYRKLKHAVNAGLESFSSGTELTPENWPHFKDMDQIISKQEPLRHMLLSDNSVFEYSVEYSVSAKRFRPNDDCPAVEVVDTSSQAPPVPAPSPAIKPECEPSIKPECDSTGLPRSEVVQRLIALHERFINLYERLVTILEKSPE